MSRKLPSFDCFIMIKKILGEILQAPKQCDGENPTINKCWNLASLAILMVEKWMPFLFISCLLLKFWQLGFCRSCLMALLDFEKLPWLCKLQFIFLSWSLAQRTGDTMAMTITLIDQQKTAKSEPNNRLASSNMWSPKLADTVSFDT